MATKDEALKMAIEFMQREHEFGIITDGTRNKVINACKEALERPSQKSDWTCNDVDVTNCDVNTLEQFCRDNIRLAPFFAMLAGALKKAKEPDRAGMVYYKNNACKAKYAKSPDCICWTPEKPTQEPVGGIVMKDKNGYPMAAFNTTDLEIGDFLYTHPHQWQELTDDEIAEKYKSFKFPNIAGFWEGVRWAEQALRNKNHV